ncbi:hypothetical protein AB5N19_11742 [Seiridium cardinale]|uniref:Uncharacterized protein n=1 Tax=Seiridium cardinale TaxID=138064 RepID=A0ABR2XEH0_9PEZI
MSEVAGAIGLISSVMTIWSFLGDQVPEVKAPSSNYRVTIGLDGFKDDDGNSLSNSGGSIDLVKVYNVNHELIGSGKGASIGDGDDQYGDMAIEQHGNSQSAWTEFYSGNDAICIAAISATMDEGTKWGWTGDWGYMCGLDWFPSGYVMQNRNGDKAASPKCTWIDKDHTNDIKAAAIGMNWGDLQAPKDGKPPSQDDAKKNCGDKMLAWPKDGGDQMLPASNSKRSLVRRSRRSDNRLVVSALPSHNATEVCESETSWGPDFVAEAEGFYCNMETHEAIPLCEGSTKTGCFDLDNPNGPAVVQRNGKRSTREFSGVIKWGN